MKENYVKTYNDAKNYFEGQIPVNKNELYTKAPQMDMFHLCFMIGVHKVLKDKDCYLFELDNIPDLQPSFMPKGIPDTYMNGFSASIGLMLEAKYLG